MLNNRSKMRISIKSNAIAYLFLTPWLMHLSIFVIYPYLYGMLIALYDVTYKGMKFVGLQNFIKLARDEMFWLALLTTLKICAIIIPITVIFPLAVSYVLIDAGKKFNAITKAIFYLPVVTCQVALAIAWRYMFSASIGVSVTLTTLLGVAPINWLSDLRLTIPLISVLVTSMSIAQPIIIYMTAIDGINISLFEAAVIDGAGQLRTFFSITLPLIKPSVVFVLITTTIGSLQTFLVPYLLTGGGPYNKTTTVLYLVYKNAFEYGKYGYASAEGVILFVMIGILVALQYKTTRIKEV